MNKVIQEELQKLYRPPPDSHKGQNGRLMIIGGSHLFHAASLWSLTVASRIVDLVHYSSVPENNEIVTKVKEEFRNGIVVPREDIEEYINEDDCVLIGPGMMRSEAKKVHSSWLMVHSIKDIEKIKDEGEQTEALTNYLLAKYPNKQWVIDAGALQMVDPRVIPNGAIITPHQGEFDTLFRNDISTGQQNFLDPQLAREISFYYSRSHSHSLDIRSTKILSPAAKQICVSFIASKYSCYILLKGQIDIACSPSECRMIEGGNFGMTKGGTGDVLAGLIAALACKNNPYLATIAGSYINKKAGDDLYEIMGPFFNATDLANQIPKTMKKIDL